jgi:arylsulfatase
MGETQNQEEHPYLYWEYPDETIGMKAIRMGRWKGIISNIRKGNQTMELFDLDKDVTEETDVANEHPEIVRQLYQLMDEARVQSDNPNFNF